ncbi:MAG: LamG domain-containing protein [Verrucomicrobiae bacterium]|nr:LamG domain-containing protein [Verrucomicrobiae bacterium]
MKNTPLLALLAASALAPCLAAAEPVHPKLVAHWSLDEKVDGPDLEIKDRGPHQLHGTLRNTKNAPFPVKSVKGMKGNGIEFEKEHQAWIEVKPDGALDLAPPFTIAAWVNPAEPGVMEVVSRKWDADKNGVRMRIESRGMGCGMGDGNEEFHLYSKDAVPLPGQWAFISVTHDGRQVRLWANGEEIGAKATSLAPTYACEGKPIALLLANYLGRKDAYPFHGVLDEVVLIGDALNGPELTNLAMKLKDGMRR